MKFQLPYQYSVWQQYSSNYFSIEDGYMTHFSREDSKLFQSPKKATKGRFTESQIFPLLKLIVYL